MELSDILTHYVGTPQVLALGRMVAGEAWPTFFCGGAKASASAVLMAALAKSGGAAGHCVVVAMDDEEQAGYFYHDMVQLLGSDREVLFFPSSFRRAARYGQRDAANEILRTEALARLSVPMEKGDCLFLIGYPESLAEKVTPKARLTEQTIMLKTGESYHLTDLEQQLMDRGFRRCDYVYEPGEFAVRGSILDVFSFTAEMPYRVDFFGDDVETIRSFEVDTQLSGKQYDSVSVVPNMAEGVEKTDFARLVPTDAVWAFHDFTLCVDRAAALAEQGFSAQAAMEQAENEQPMVWDEWMTPSDDLRRQWLDFRRIEFGNAPSTNAMAATCRMEVEMQPLFHKNFDLVRQSFERYLQEGYELYVLSDSEKQQERLRDIFSQTGGDLRFTAVRRTLHEGFIDHERKLCLLTDHQIFDRFYKYSLRSERARSGKVALSLKELLQFEPGDYVVHMDHGVGQFAGLVRMPSPDGSGTQEVMKLVYRGGDVVLVSIHSLHKVSKYKGRENEPPTLSHLGTGAWEKLKERTKKKIKDIARDLIKLYSERLHEKGFSFSADTFMQQELEAGFAYEDTPDQLRVTQEVKADMERDRPMDRLVCGDVGFGKTEIAVRAAFKAASDNKQVAVMVPTTVLALQHYKTFKKRLADFPVRVDYLSRARSGAATKQVLKDLADGEINIIVGTHKLIGKSVKFKDLGLLVIDEEQKFGVSVKERLRQLKANVDTLTMSATPIPRTLQFSLMGARDFSVIQTPPPNRRPIQTEIHTFSAEVIAEAVNFEMSRNGQVYIVSSRISSLGTIANLIHKHVPDARVAIGHGQMPPAQLEDIITGFVNYDFDVLICTTIVENGVDIPNANTIIIDGAHHFGLSDLHQMRGRVGRSDRKAFCYLLAPPLGALPQEARRRLQAVENFSDLGSGIHIAMQDLDIRGAGNLLGAEQSGFVADLGYEAYRKILTQAVTELKNDEFSDLYAEELAQDKELSGDAFVDECTLECDLRAFLPETYVPGSAERMMLYRELDSMNTDEQVMAFSSRLKDRFGPIPPEGEELLRIVRLRRMARSYGVERVLLKSGRMILNFVGNADSPFYQSAAFDRIIRYATTHIHECVLKEDAGKRKMRFDKVKSVKQALEIFQSME